MHVIMIHNSGVNASLHNMSNNINSMLISSCHTLLHAMCVHKTTQHMSQYIPPQLEVRLISGFCGHQLESVLQVGLEPRFTGTW